MFSPNLDTCTIINMKSPDINNYFNKILFKSVKSTALIL